MRAAVLLAALALLPGAALALVEPAARLARQPGAWPLAAGALAAVLVSLPLLRRFPVLETFEHELTHALAALCLLRGVHGFKVTLREGGYVEHAGGSRLGDDLIGFAPYMVPTLTLAAALFAPRVSAEGRPGYLGFVGATFGYHLVSNLREIRGSFTKRRFRGAGGGRAVQSDIGRRGYCYSAAFILAGLLLFHGLALALLADGYAGVPAWARALWRGTASAGAALAAWAQGVGTGR